MASKKIYRSCRNRIIGGVAGGLGEYFDIDPILIRLVFVILAFAGLSGVLIYLIAWLIIPEDPACNSKKSGADEMREKVKTFTSTIKLKTGQNEGNRIALGAIIILLGIIFLLQNIFGINVCSVLWPLIIIGVGVFLLSKSQGKAK